MIWLVILFFCETEHDCKFAYFEAISVMQCEKKLADLKAVVVSNRIPFHAGTCVPIAGHRLKNG